jgi:arylsulfate sulfotransferase
LAFRLALAALLIASPCALAQLTLKVEPAEPETLPVGELYSFGAAVDSTSPGPIWFRFGMYDPEGAYSLIRDFGPESVLVWGTIKRSGDYQLEVTARDLSSGETARSLIRIRLTPLVDGTRPVIQPTPHPSVFIYSSPQCPRGSFMQVRVNGPAGHAYETQWEPCDPRYSKNFYLAGFRPSSTYTAQHVLSDGKKEILGPALQFETQPVDLLLANYKVLTDGALPTQNRFLLQSSLALAPVATDLDGTPLWFYGGGLSTLTRVFPGGYFLGIIQDPLAGPSRQVFRMFDLAGITQKETNAARVNEQLEAMGKYPITSFHHEARLLPDGHFLVLAANERILTDVQGPGEVNVIGDTVLVFDQDLNVTWVWDAFDHINPSQTAVLGETCTPTGGGCPSFYLSGLANDWLHTNSLQLTDDGGIILSVRHLDQVIKVNYDNGNGDGSILWRLGKNADFHTPSADPWPFFSHQHDPQFLPESNQLLVFDNGNTRQSQDNTAHSRGQLWTLDEASRTADLSLNCDLGLYSFALGSAQKLPNGNYHFNLGLLLPALASRQVEVDSACNIVYSLQANTPIYRSFRLSSLYSGE